MPWGRQRLWVVHAVAPMPVSFDEWKGQLHEIYRQLQKTGPNRLLVMGDFNATWGSQGFRQILTTGLVDAAAARARPFEMTWSQTKPVVPPLVRIDHILTGSGVEVTAIETGRGVGSDHRDLVATVAFDQR